jgi:hypothetical protein
MAKEVGLATTDLPIIYFPAGEQVAFVRKRSLNSPGTRQGLYLRNIWCDLHVMDFALLGTGRGYACMKCLSTLETVVGPGYRMSDEIWRST